MIISTCSSKDWSSGRPTIGCLQSMMRCRRCFSLLRRDCQRSWPNTGLRHPSISRSPFILSPSVAGHFIKKWVRSSGSLQHSRHWSEPPLYLACLHWTWYCCVRILALTLALIMSMRLYAVLFHTGCVFPSVQDMVPRYIRLVLCVASCLSWFVQ